MRLDKFISEMTTYSRSEAKTLLRQKKIKVNDLIIAKGDVQIDPEKDLVTVQGQPVVHQSSVCLLLNKPAGYVCATEDTRDPTVLELVPPSMQRKGLFPAGRLDKDTCGMVILTNDGDLAHRMLSPKRHVTKYYLVRLVRPFDTTYCDAFAEGLQLKDGTNCLPAQTAALPELENGFWALAALQEGKYHQVKRMFAAVGNHVEQLIRIGMGELLLPADLPLGGCIELLDKEIEELLKCESDFSTRLQRLKENSSYLINVTR